MAACVPRLQGVGALVKQRVEEAAEGKMPHCRPLLLFPEVRHPTVCSLVETKGLAELAPAVYIPCYLFCEAPALRLAHCGREPPPTASTCCPSRRGPSWRGSQCSRSSCAMARCGGELLLPGWGAAAGGTCRARGNVGTGAESERPMNGSLQQ